MPLEMLGDAFLSQQRLLVVAPHPDDEAIGYAGTIARVKALSGQVYVMIVSAGGITQHGRGAGGQGREFVPGEQRRAEFEDMTRAAGPREHTSRCCEGCRGLDTQFGPGRSPRAPGWRPCVGPIRMIVTAGALGYQCRESGRPVDRDRPGQSGRCGPLPISRQ